MAFNLGTLGSILGGAGGLVSGISGLFGKKDKAPGPEAQSNAAMKNLHRSFSYIVQGAKAAGIHPLVALGSSAAGSFASPVPFASSGGFSGDAIGQGLAAAGGALRDFYQQDLDEVASEEEARQRRAELEYRKDQDQSQAMDRILDRAQQERALDIQEKQADAMMLDATSRSVLNQARAQAQGGPVLLSSDSAGELKTPFGFSLSPADTVDAQTASDRWGDVIGEVFGAGNLIRDLWKKGNEQSLTLPPGRLGPRRVVE